MLHYNFKRKKIWDDEPPRPVMEVKKPFAMLGDLGNGNLQTLRGVNAAIRNIEKVMKGEKKKYSFGGSDACLIEVGASTSRVAYEFGEKEATVPTAALLDLLQEWKAFLSKKIIQ